MLRKGTLKTSKVLGGHACNITILWEFRHFFLQEFKFNKSIMKHNEIRFKTAIKKWKNKTKREDENIDPVVVTVHVRRTDYISYLKRTNIGEVMGVPYFKNAFSYFIKK